MNSSSNQKSNTKSQTKQLAQDCGHTHSKSHNHSSDPAGDHHHHHGNHHHHHIEGHIGVAFVLNFILSLIELFGGMFINSMAITAGAIHDLGDALSLGIAWYLEKLSVKQKSEAFNFGYRRFSLLSAVISGVIILIGSILIIVHSIENFSDKHIPDPKWMIGFSVLGILVNAYSAYRMSQAQGHHAKILTWHLLQDFLSWTSVLIISLCLFWYDLTWLDPVLAICLSLFVAFNVLKQLHASVYLFLQGRPKDFDEENFKKAILNIDGICKVSHIGLWSLDGIHNIMSFRVTYNKNMDLAELERKNQSIRKMIQDFGHFDVTIETHFQENCECPNDSI